MVEPHHDGSPMYVPEGSPQLGDRLTVWLTVPRSAAVAEVLLRYTHDGEGSVVRATEDPHRSQGHTAWWSADLPVHNPVVRYRWQLRRPRGGRRRTTWVTAIGEVGHTPTDATDFVISTHAPPAAWTAEAAVYQVFPDRFARSALAAHRSWPEWAIPATWGDPVEREQPGRSQQLFGGDLDGIADHLDHITGLGVDTIWLTPIFPAESNHRYDAASFDTVDPLLGGDDALRRLRRACDAAGVRLIGDLTANHTGSAHEWFAAAVTDPTSEEADYYVRDTAAEAHPDGFARWFGVPSLPKLDHGSAALRQRLWDGPGSVAARWIGPDGFHGWRVDVANQTGRFGAADHNADVARGLQATVRAADPDAVVVAEHGYDASSSLQGDGWDAAMNYAGFAGPVWGWLRAEDLTHPVTGTEAFGPEQSMPWLDPHGGVEMLAGLRAFLGAIPWSVATRQWNQLASHDTMRTATLTGDPEVHRLAVWCLVTLPGVPVVFAGDEWGLQGWDGEESRVPMPWDQSTDGGQEPDPSLVETYRQALAVRRASPALLHGGFRPLDATADSVTFLREHPDERVLVHLRRAAVSPVSVRAADLDTSGLVDLLAGEPGLPGGEPDSGGEPDLPGWEPDSGGEPDLVAGLLTLPGHGTAVGIWRLLRSGP